MASQHVTSHQITSHHFTLLLMFLQTLPCVTSHHINSLRCHTRRFQNVGSNISMSTLDAKVYPTLPLCKLALYLHTTIRRDKKPVMYLQLFHNDGKTVEQNETQQMNRGNNVAELSRSQNPLWCVHLLLLSASIDLPDSMTPVMRKCMCALIFCRGSVCFAYQPGGSARVWIFFLGAHFSSDDRRSVFESGRSTFIASVSAKIWVVRMRSLLVVGAKHNPRS